MSWHIESIKLFVRELPPDRAMFVIGKKSADGKQAAPKKRRPRGFLVVRMEVADDRGNRTWGVSGDRPSFGWLDKRHKYTAEQKLQRLLELVVVGQHVYLENPSFETPFQYALENYAVIQNLAERNDHEPLTGSFAAALFERAMIDAVCRAQKLSIFEALQDDRLGFRPADIFPELKAVKTAHVLPARPTTEFFIRHTVGLGDPLTKSDLPLDQRVNDGEPETLEEYVQRDGLTHFKVKISGDADADLDRLGRIWSVVVRSPQPVVTLDGNESYSDINAFARFVAEFEQQHLGLFQHTAFIEQPLTRALTHDSSTAEAITEISKSKPLVIDEADGDFESFRKASKIGYSGTSHKNCKGFFKSLANQALCHHLQLSEGRPAFLTGEDLSNMPLVPLHQDFAALGCLGITHCERNGHHYGFGLRHLSETEQTQVRKYHHDLYVERNGDLFLNIRNGMVNCRSLQIPGFGVAFESDIRSLTPLSDWDVKW